MMTYYSPTQQITSTVCRFCGWEYDAEDSFDKCDIGFWCDACDGFTYYDPDAEMHRFTLLLEDKQSQGTNPPITNVKFSKQLSPLRYPGGKSKFIPFVYDKMQKNASRTLIGAFAGGASVELALLHAKIIDKLVLNDLDIGVYSLFTIIKEDPDSLIKRIQSFQPTHEAFFQTQTVVKDGYTGCSTSEAAWALLVVNRLAYSGIYKANPLGGRYGSIKELTSRWNPISLSKRIRTIHQMSDAITVLNMDACELIEEAYWTPDTTIFIDPPYVQKGKQLYRHYYDSDEHVRLNVLLDSLYQGMPGADIILVYDNDPWLRDLYLYPTIETVSRVYSV